MFITFLKVNDFTRSSKNEYIRRYENVARVTSSSRIGKLTIWKSKQWKVNRYNYLTPSVQHTHQSERRTYLKQQHHNQNTTSRTPKGQFLFQTIGQTAIQNKIFTRTYMQRHTMAEIVNHSRSTALERSVKTLLGSLNRFYVATSLALSSAVVYTDTKEGNDQESIQLSNIFRQRHQRERRTHLKQRHHN